MASGLVASACYRHSGTSPPAAAIVRPGGCQRGLGGGNRQHKGEILRAGGCPGLGRCEIDFTRGHVAAQIQEER